MEGKRERNDHVCIQRRLFVAPRSKGGVFGLARGLGDLFGGSAASILWHGRDVR
jgi:hypothetical protein